MKKIAVVLAIFLVGCGTSTHTEIRTINGHDAICSWSEPGWNPFGTKREFICEPILVQP